MGIDYHDYISSSAWRSNPARLAELRSARFKCRLCENGPPTVVIEVHHRTYVRLGREEAADLCTLCRDCHHVVTDELRRRRYRSRPVGADSAADVRPPLLGRSLRDSLREDW